ncbi:hypothetical protein RI367_004093 [Sorochytrium milnesiophthora]
MDRLEASWREIPPITRTWVTLTVVMSLLTFFQLVAPLHLIFDWHYIARRREWWRIFTSFLYFGPFGIDFVLHMFFMSRYCRQLEEGSFRSRPADFAFLLLLSACTLVAVAALFPALQLRFLGGPLSFVLVYVWSRRNPYLHMSLFGVFNFSAPYLPWVLLAMGAILHELPVADLIGAAIGHVFWFLEDVYPLLLDRNGRRRARILKAPRFMRVWFGQAQTPEELEADIAEPVVAAAAAPVQEEVPPPPPPPVQQQEQVAPEEPAEEQHPPVIDLPATEPESSVKPRKSYANQDEDHSNATAAAAPAESSSSAGAYWDNLGTGNRLS